jgi:hypothetical protein
MGARRKNCESYWVFERNIIRAAAFLRLFGDGRVPGKPSADDVQLLLGCVVFSVGALDALLHDLVLEIVPTFALGSSPALSDALKAIAKDDPSLALKAVLAPDRAAAVFREALGNYLGQKAFQGTEAVKRAMGYVGIEVPGDGMDGWLNRPGSTALLAEFTKMRNGIVHRGEQPKLKAGKAGECIQLVSAIAKKVNASVVVAYYSPQKKADTDG